MDNWYDEYDDRSDEPTVTERNRDDLYERLAEMEDLISLYEEVERRFESLECSDIDEVKSEAEKLQQAISDFDYREGLNFQREMERWIG